MIIIGSQFLFFGDSKMPLFGKKVVLSKSNLMQRLVELSQKNNLFTLSSSPETDYVVETKIVDASGYGITGADELEKNYKAFLLIDEEEHEARYSEELQESSRAATISAAGLNVSEEKKFFRGKVIGQKESGKEWGLKKGGDPSSLGKVYDYNFDVSKIRDPIRKLVEDSGWKFRQVTSKGDATYKSAR